VYLVIEQVGRRIALQAAVSRPVGKLQNVKNPALRVRRRVAVDSEL
jgi:hypothetical protein